MLLFDHTTASGKSVKHTATGSVCFACDLKNASERDNVSILVEQEAGAGQVFAWTFDKDGFQWLDLPNGASYQAVFTNKSGNASVTLSAIS